MVGRLTPRNRAAAEMERSCLSDSAWLLVCFDEIALRTRLFLRSISLSCSRRHLGLQYVLRDAVVWNGLPHCGQRSVTAQFLIFYESFPKVLREAIFMGRFL